MEVLNDILGYKNRKIYQNSDWFSFSLDSVMLANFATIRLRDKNIADLGCGNGVIPLILSLRTDKRIVGVEIQKNVSEMALKSVLYNGLEQQIKIVNQDMKKICGDSNYFESFDLITCNPPYFKVNEKNYFNVCQEKVLARHEVAITLEEVCSVAKKMLKNNGNFAIVHRTDRLMEILSEFRKNDIEPKRIQFVYETIDKGSTLVLIEGQKNGSVGLKVEKPFIMYDVDGKMTDDYAKMQVEVS